MVAEPEGPFWWQAAIQLIKTQDEATSCKSGQEVQKTVYGERQATEEMKKEEQDN